jgi:phosphatidyl-myo-inositol dimannoside synthase
MRVIYISHLHPSEEDALSNIGGTQTVSVQILKALEQHPDVTVHPILLKGSGRWIELRSLWFLLKLYRTLPQIIAAEEGDLVFFISMVTASMAFFLRHKIRIPMVTLNHGQDVIDRFWPYQQLVRRVFKSLDGVVSVSSATSAACLARGLSPAKATVLPNGIVVDVHRPFSQQGSRAYLEQALNLKLGHQSLLLSVGRQVKRKGHAWFIQQVLPLIETDVLLLLIGDGSEAQTLHRLKQESPQGDRIILAGKVSPALLQHAYDAADLFVMPNIPVAGDMEGFGVVILEANEARTPAIASALEGIQDVICSGVNGYTVEPLNPHRFAAAVDAALQNDLATLSATSYQHVLKHHQWDAIGDRYVAFFQRVITRNNCQSGQGLPSRP